jgi:hypothetical protein
MLFVDRTKPSIATASDFPTKSGVKAAFGAAKRFQS